MTTPISHKPKLLFTLLLLITGFCSQSAFASSLTVTAGPNIGLCQGQSHQLNAVASGGSHVYTAYKWSPATGLSNPNIANPIVQLTGSTTYTVKVYDSYNDSATANITVTYLNQAPPHVDSFSSTHNCNTLLLLQYSTTCVNTHGGATPYKYKWNTGDSTQCFRPDTNGVYSVTVTDNAGCTANFTGQAYTLADYTATLHSTICHGVPDSLSINIDNGVPPFSYQFSTGWNNAPLITQNGTYAVTVTDATGCAKSTSVTYASESSGFLIVGNNGLQAGDSVCAGVRPGVGIQGNGWASIIAWCNRINGGIGFSTNVSTGFYQLYTDLSPGEAYYTVASSCYKTPLDSFKIKIVPCGSDSVWPGDANNDGIANYSDLLPIGLAYGATGPVRAGALLYWAAQSCSNWYQYLPDSTDYKHIDCNGDGTINATDTVAIHQNYNRTHNRGNSDQAWRSGQPTLKISFSADTVGDGDHLIAHLLLGDSIIPADSIYGLRFVFYFDPLAVDTDSISVSIGNSWLCNSTDHLDMHRVYASEGGIEVALTRIDHAARSGEGEIGAITLKITTGNINGKDYSYYNMQCSISDLLVLDKYGNQIPVNAGFDSVKVAYLPTGVKHLSQQLRFNLYPNPAKNYVLVQTDDNCIGGKIELRDLSGRLLTQGTINSKTERIETSAIAAGVYFVSITSQQQQKAIKMLTIE